MHYKIKIAQMNANDYQAFLIRYFFISVIYKACSRLEINFSIDRFKIIQMVIQIK